MLTSINCAFCGKTMITKSSNPNAKQRQIFCCQGFTAIFSKRLDRIEIWNRKFTIYNKNNTFTDFDLVIYKDLKIVNNFVISMTDDDVIDKHIAEVALEKAVLLMGMKTFF